MNGSLRCVGYVKPMESFPRIKVTDVETQERNIRKFAEKLGSSLSCIYCEENSSSVSAYRRLCEDAVHRNFDALILDDFFCFGADIFAAADLIENVLLPMGFRVFIAHNGMCSDDPDLIGHLSRCKGSMRSSLAAVSQKKNQADGIKSRRSKKMPVLDICHDLQWYEERQTALFRQMMLFPENFPELEDELRSCRRAIKKLRS